MWRSLGILLRKSFEEVLLKRRHHPRQPVGQMPENSGLNEGEEDTTALVQDDRENRVGNFISGGL